MPEVKLPSEWGALVARLTKLERWYGGKETDRAMVTVGPKTPLAKALREAIAALESPSAAPEPGGWLPIESAPRDGTEFIGFVPVANKARAMLWRRNWEQWQMVPGYAKAKPTHWQPLPSPPQPSRQAGGGKVMVPTMPPQQLASDVPVLKERHLLRRDDEDPAEYERLIDKWRLIHDAEIAAEAAQPKEET